MSVAQPCPDSLLARARAGTLSSPERRQLQGHLAQCETCRVNLVVGQDFDAALGARPDDTMLVSRVVDAVRASSTLRASVSPRSRRARGAGRWFVYGIAAALLTISCVVGASRPSIRRTVAVFLGLQAREIRRDAPTPDNVPRAEPKRVAYEPTPLPTAANVEAPLAPIDKPRAPPRARAPIVADNPPAPEGTSAKDFFAQANARRRAGDEPGAKKLYQELQLRYPQSPEAEVSRVALGRLLLERWQDPKAALEQFDRAMSPPGPSDQAGLAEEALFGRATALMRLGRTDDERKTWAQLLERFPASVYADRARARLDELK